MLDSITVDSVRRLLADGKLSMRKIARASGVSRGTVLAIAHGRRRDRPRRTPDDDPFSRPTGPLHRCPDCGGLAHMPCRVCHVRQWKSSPRSTPMPRRPEHPLQLELLGEHRLRYEQIRARRRNDDKVTGRRDDGVTR
jgi:hypothetical protein